MIKSMIALVVIFVVAACSTPEKPLPACVEIVQPIVEDYKKQKAAYIGSVSENGLQVEIFENDQFGFAIIFGEDATMAAVNFPPDQVSIEHSGRCVVPNLPPLQYRAIKVKKPAQQERTL